MESRRRASAAVLMAADLPRIVQGGMGVQVSNWKLARAVARRAGVRVRGAEPRALERRVLGALARRPRWKRRWSCRVGVRVEHVTETAGSHRSAARGCEQVRETPAQQGQACHAWQYMFGQ